MLAPEVQQVGLKVIENVERVVVGKREVIVFALAAILAGGHILMEDVPGVGKTILCRSLARSFNCTFKRLQFTPDLLPTDITGLSVYNLRSQEFEFHAGPIFSHFLLVDEINRATPKTQSALLEAMGEKQTTIDGVTYQLNEPFVVLATQNPIEYEGTFPLPEAQVDRFSIRLRMGYPTEPQEISMLERLRVSHPIYTLEAVSSREELLAAIRTTKEVTVDQTVLSYIVDIATATRQHLDVYLGVSPRASLALLHISQGLAILEGRDYVMPDDVKKAARVVLPHRLILKTEARLRGETGESILEEVLLSVPVPLGI